MVEQEKTRGSTYVMNSTFTTASIYVTGTPHIGHALEKIQADVLAALPSRKRGQSVFLTARRAWGENNASGKRRGTQVGAFVDGMADRFRAYERRAQFVVG